MKFANLAPRVQQRLLQEVAEQLDYDWWDCLEEMYIEDGKERGFDIEKMFWSGFWSQGDGASWVGTIGIKRFLAYHLKLETPQFARYTILQELAANGWVDSYVSITAHGRYSHEYTMQCGGIEADVVGGVLREGLLAGADPEVLYDSIDGDSLLSDLGDWLLEEAQDYARKYYESLEKEYDYLTSEEALIERDLDYDEDGEEISPEEPEPAELATTEGE
jgi:hypothetical protein